MPRSSNMPGKDSASVSKCASRVCSGCDKQHLLLFVEQLIEPTLHCGAYRRVAQLLVIDICTLVAMRTLGDHCEHYRNLEDGD